MIQEAIVSAMRQVLGINARKKETQWLLLADISAYLKKEN